MGTSEGHMVLTLAILKKRYTIHRFAPDSTIPEMVFQSEFYTLSRTDEELSIVCDSAIDLKSPKSEKDYRITSVRNNIRTISVAYRYRWYQFCNPYP